MNFETRARQQQRDRRWYQRQLPIYDGQYKNVEVESGQDFPVWTICLIVMLALVSVAYWYQSNSYDALLKRMAQDTVDQQQVYKLKDDLRVIKSIAETRARALETSESTASTYRSLYHAAIRDRQELQQRIQVLEEADRSLARLNKDECKRILRGVQSQVERELSQRNTYSVQSLRITPQPVTNNMTSCHADSFGRVPQECRAIVPMQTSESSAVGSGRATTSVYEQSYSSCNSASAAC